MPAEQMTVLQVEPRLRQLENALREFFLHLLAHDLVKFDQISLGRHLHEPIDLYPKWFMRSSYLLLLRRSEAIISAFFRLKSHEPCSLKEIVIPDHDLVQDSAI